MFEEKMNEILNNKEFMNAFLETNTDENYFVNESKICYSLKECLEKCSEKVLNTILVNYEVFLEVNCSSIKNKPKTEVVDFLYDTISNSFFESLNSLDKEEQKILSDAANNKGISYNKSNSMLFAGLMFAFSHNNKISYVIPSEILKLYNGIGISEEYHKNELENLLRQINSYLYVNLLISKEFIDEIINETCKSKISESEIKEILKQSNTLLYKNNYYVINGLGAMVNIDKIIEEKNRLSYRKFFDYEFIMYHNEIQEFSKKLSRVLKISNIDAEEIIITKLSLVYLNVDQILELLSEKFDKTALKKLRKVLEDNIHVLRYSTWNGRTLSEYLSEMRIKDFILKSKPKTNSLEECLKCLNVETKEEICDNLCFNVSSSTSIEQFIINNFKEYVSNLSFGEVEIILDSDGEIINYDIDTYLFEYGYLYAYQEFNKIKVIIPNEIKKMLMKANDKFLGYYDEEYILKELVYRYLVNNGIIESTRLLEILKEEHGIDIRIKYLDKIVKDLDGVIYKKKYYTLIMDISDCEFENLISLKNSFGKYKIVDLYEDDREDELNENLREFLHTEIRNLNDMEDEILNFIIMSIKHASFSLICLDSIFETLNLSIQEKDKKKIFDFVKLYKNNISVWVYNGYSINEYNKLIHKNKKVGRNDPCPCGSGKKYKQCCGK